MHFQKKIGLALSGGGYRAAAFHIGTLKKLHELGLLEKVDKLSTISGGSITGAKYCLYKGRFEDFEKEMRQIITSKGAIRLVLLSWQFLLLATVFITVLVFSIIMLFYNPLLSLLTPIIFLIFLIKFQFKLFPVSKIIEKAYDSIFYHGATLSDLCEKPEIAIGSTNLQTLRHFTFSKRKMEDGKYAHMDNPIFFVGQKFPVSRAVMASSSVPFAFTPVSISKEFYQIEENFTKVNPKLVDGGVYDNQGIHKLTQKNSSYYCDIVIVSDAGNKLPLDKSYNNTITLLLRTVETFMARIKHFQMIKSLYSSQNSQEIAFHSLGWDLESCIPGFHENLVDGNIPQSVLVAHQFNQDWVEKPEKYKKEIIECLKEKCEFDKIQSTGLKNKTDLDEIRKVTTNLTKIKAKLVDNLIIHAASLTELQIRLYCPTLMNDLIKA